MTADNKDVDDGTHDDSSTAIASAVEDTRKKVISTLFVKISSCSCSVTPLTINLRVMRLLTLLG